MKAAFSFWKGRIAPVFDVARHVLIVEVESGRIIREVEKDLPQNNPGRKIKRLAGIGIDTLVCGAISRFMHELITSHGINVISFVSGDLREVIRAWGQDKIDEADFAMPGCCRRLRTRSGCAAASGQWNLYICPRCGHQRWYKKDIYGMGKVCPRCESIMLTGRE